MCEYSDFSQKLVHEIYLNIKQTNQDSFKNITNMYTGIIENMLSVDKKDYVINLQNEVLDEARIKALSHQLINKYFLKYDFTKVDKAYCLNVLSKMFSNFIAMSSMYDKIM